jgi:hypothetical protein
MTTSSVCLLIDGGLVPIFGVCHRSAFLSPISIGCPKAAELQIFSTFSLGIAFVTTEVYQFSIEMAVPSSLKLVFFGLLISLISGVVTGLDVGGLAGGAGGAGGGGLVKPASGLGGAGERSLKCTDSL